jgi:cyclopropane-fatty-acyl-phospholipid synthase
MCVWQITRCLNVLKEQSLVGSCDSSHIPFGGRLMHPSLLSQSVLNERPLEPEAGSMASQLIGSPDRDWLTWIEQGLTRRLLQVVGNPSVTIQLGDFPLNALSAGSNSPRVIVHDHRTLWKLAFDPMFQFGKAYEEGRVDVSGDLNEVLSLLFRSISSSKGQWNLVDSFLRCWHSPNLNSLTGSRDNIHHHYDLGNDFYRLWLDDQMLYTCAYFPHVGSTLEQAQLAKMELVCRKLSLQPGETVVEAGCGWGGLALYMAKHYGVQVYAFNISKEQLEYARQSARRDGLDGQVHFIEDDWRNIQWPCDAFVSVGMLEHVGVANYTKLGAVVRRCIGNQGRGLIHSIGQTHPCPLNPWIERRIFPGAYPPTLRQMMDIFEPHDLAVLDVDNLRLHYAETLRHWGERFEKAATQVAKQFGERFVRTWRLYLAGSKSAFDTGALHLFQVLFSAEDNNHHRTTRNAIYQTPLV